MTQEEKAEAYDRAIETARKLNNGEGVEAPPDWTICEVIFPELKKSDDERIRKAIKKALQVKCDDSRIISDEPVTLEEALAWLEKQGEKKPNNQFTPEQANILDRHIDKFLEQKSAENVKPKFKVEDWIVNNDKRIAVPTQILKIEKYGYATSRGYISFDKVKTDYHLLTITDAKG